MKKVLIVLFVLISFVGVSWASDSSNDKMLNIISMDLISQQWLKTKTAVITIKIDAAINNNKLSDLYDKVDESLKALIPGASWNVTTFSRKTTTSGLDSVEATAETRIENQSVSGLQGKLKSMSQPGMNFTLEHVDYTPSIKELTQLKNNLRSDIYQQAIAQEKILNQTFSDAHYVIHRISFMDNIFRPLLITTTNNLARRIQQNQEKSSLPVSSQISLVARVEFANNMASN
ncbi:MAG: hypothetical protein ACE365_01455 [Gammaproteobacteria bacterium]